MSEPHAWLRENEAASRLRLHPATLRSMRRESRGPKFGRAGRNILYRPEDLDAWVSAQAGDQEGRADG